jgi:hypothetical protein
MKLGLTKSGENDASSQGANGSVWGGRTRQGRARRRLRWLRAATCQATVPSLPTMKAAGMPALAPFSTRTPLAASTQGVSSINARGQRTRFAAPRPSSIHPCFHASTQLSCRCLARSRPSNPYAIHTPMHGKIHTPKSIGVLGPKSIGVLGPK